MSVEALERYNLPAVVFDPDAFMEQHGRRLAAAHMDDLAEEIVALGSVRELFLAKPLQAEQAHAINGDEGPQVAQEAAVFQARVAGVNIAENFEPMKNLAELAARQDYPWSFSTEPFHPASGAWADKPRLFWARKGVADRLSALGSQFMRAQFGLHFEDGFRPLGVQEGLFRRRYAMAATQHPEWSHTERLMEARSKTAYTPRFASHKGGAAVDIRVRDLETGQLLDIGHAYPDGGAIVALESPFVTQQQWANRMVLARSALREGLALYPFEDWHVCTGDTTAAACQEGTPPAAQYGPVKSFSLETGEIEDVYRRDELDTTFSWSSS